MLWIICFTVIAVERRQKYFLWVSVCQRVFHMTNLIVTFIPFAKPWILITTILDIIRTSEKSLFQKKTKRFFKCFERKKTLHQQVRKSFESNWDLKESHDLDYEKQLLKAMSSKAPRKAKAKSSNLRSFMELNSIRSWDCFRSHNIEGFLPVIFPFVQDSLTKYDSSYWSSS